MRVRSTSRVHVDLIVDKSEVAEIAKAAMALGYHLDLAPVREGAGPGSSAILMREAEIWGSQDLAAQVYLHALASDAAPDRILKDIRSTLEGMGVDCDSKPADVRPIGEGSSD